jgi:two-component system CheB/CheR fusion protein
MDKHSPAYFVIDKKHDILRFSGGEAAPYLEPSAGTASLNLFSLLRRALRSQVRAAVPRWLEIEATAKISSRSYCTPPQPFADGNSSQSRRQ